MSSSQNLFRYLLLAGSFALLPSVSFAAIVDGLGTGGAIILMIAVVLVPVLAFGVCFVLFQILMVKKFGVVKTSKKWWQCFFLAGAINVGLSYLLNFLSIFVFILIPDISRILMTGVLVLMPLPFAYYIAHKIIK